MQDERLFQIVSHCTYLPFFRKNTFKFICKAIAAIKFLMLYEKTSPFHVRRNICQASSSSILPTYHRYRFKVSIIIQYVQLILFHQYLLLCTTFFCQCLLQLQKVKHTVTFNNQLINDSTPTTPAALLAMSGIVVKSVLLVNGGGIQQPFQQLGGRHPRLQETQVE